MLDLQYLSYQNFICLNSIINTLKPNFKDVSLLYMDTDAFVLHIKDGNVFHKFNNLKI